VVVANGDQVLVFITPRI